MSTLADTVILEPPVNPDDVRLCLIEAVNLAWQVGGNDGRCSVPANFVGWVLQENARLHQWVFATARSLTESGLSLEEYNEITRGVIDQFTPSLNIHKQPKEPA